MAAPNNYVSIHCDIHVAIRTLDLSEEALVGVFQQRSSQLGIYSQIEYLKHKLQPGLRNIRKRDPDIADWLEFMDNSISSIARHMSDTFGTETQTTAQRVSLSAIGLELTLQSELQADVAVELVLALPLSSVKMMIVGRVSRVEYTDSGFLTNLEFEHIREADQEILIRHIHQTQLEELQQARRCRENTATI